MYHKIINTFTLAQTKYSTNPLNLFYKFNLSRFSSSITPSNKKISAKSEPSQTHNQEGLLEGDLNEDYVKYFKPKKDRMRSFLQGHVKRVKLRGPNYNDYSKFKLRPFNQLQSSRH